MKLLVRKRVHLVLFAASLLAIVALWTGISLAFSPGQQNDRPRRADTPQQQNSAPQKGEPQEEAPPPPVPVPKLQDKAQPPSGEELDPNDTIKINANEVKLNVRVVDRMNRPVSDIRKEDFHVFEDGVQQTIASFTRQEVPVSYGLVIDNSGSIRSQLEKVIDAGKTIVSSNRAGDETFLVRFISSDKIETLQDFTSNEALLMEALDNMYIEGGQTAVLDAVFLSSEHVSSYKKGNDLDDRRRRALILVTDGEDRSSYYKEKQLFDRLREQDVQIYVIGFVNELDKNGGIIHKSPREKAVALLNRLAQETGGRAFFPNSLSELPSIAQDITKDLRTQFVLSYIPTDAAGRSKPRDGAYRAVHVTIASEAGRDKRIAITRPGYTAPREGGTAARKAA